jgi:hypothetical protein
MDKKLAVHVAAETVVLGSLTVYLINRIGALESRISELEKDLQVTAKHTVLAERKQVEVLNAMSHLIKGNQKSEVRHFESPHDKRTHIVHSAKKPAPTQPTVDKKKVSFSDISSSEEEEISSEEEEIKEVTIAPKPKTRHSAKGKNIKVTGPTTPATKPSKKGMDDVRAAAAALAPPDDEE